ncbi:MAG: carboxypeptidase-like regulatory domain-containing protein [Terracidiphilus sp.]
MARLRSLSALSIAFVLLAGCNKFQHKKPDPTKGVVTGIVLCADTGKPARFATVALTAVPKAGEKNDQDDPLPAAEMTVTDLDGRFRMEAVPPGRYYAFATLEGYLDPALGLDPDKLKSLSNDRDRHKYSIEQWKDHLTEVTVGVRRASEISIEIEHAAEIAGTVTFDDGSPAIGMRFQLFRKTEKDWTGVGLPLMDTWSIRTISDSHGRYSITNLPAAEYTVCALMPTDTEQASARVCLGDVFLRKNAKTVKVAAGETAGGNDIEIPLSGLHTVSGEVTALADGHSLAHGSVRLLYADDREGARETALQDDGSFSLDYVPEGNYILQVSGAGDADPKVSEPAVTGPDAQPASHAPVVHYTDKEVPLRVLANMTDMQVSLSAAQQDNPQPKLQSQ